ncbi:uncharacterized protein PG998_014167 [Apiospora kogelbergensis]|uniref:uncharacterized protein n=1 Tax=Apiospora kogelbergensis TaxID=1337665 RepID=UPI003130A523
MSENGGPLNITVGPNSNSSNNARLSVTPTSLQDVRLTITWLHHSSARILETDAALAYVRNPHAFDNLRAADVATPQAPLCVHGLCHPSSDDDDGRRLALRATVKRAWFGEESWDLASYRGGDDLARLFASLGGQGTIPRLEVEVDYPRSWAQGYGTRRGICVLVS